MLIRQLTKIRGAHVIYNIMQHWPPCQHQTDLTQNIHTECNSWTFARAKTWITEEDIYLRDNNVDFKQLKFPFRFRIDQCLKSKEANFHDYVFCLLKSPPGEAHYFQIRFQPWVNCNVQVYLMSTNVSYLQALGDSDFHIIWARLIDDRSDHIFCLNTNTSFGINNKC